MYAPFKDDGTGDAGAVVRNYKGEAIAGACWPLQHLLDAATTKAKAL